ncbi:MAG TPA: cell envelope biogenesis protein OmpA, partial [Cyanobacteria bacterium UBA11367]|nr:cell envelope biogenesis protein OmpA [Cyanobacteria bacterium UBA11367]
PPPPPPPPPVQNATAIVNSNQDEVKKDEKLTLREAIGIVNGEIDIAKLSPAEKAQVTISATATNSRIEFNLPPGETTIYLQEILPALASPGLVVDGTSQPGYDKSKSPTTAIAIPQPIIAIVPESDRQILRGLTIVSDRVNIKGLSIYGFKEFKPSLVDPQGVTLLTPPADIFIAHKAPPPTINPEKDPPHRFPFWEKDAAPKDVVIEMNWLGMPPTGEIPQKNSAFGVSVFNSFGTTIRRNRIVYHDGSGIITSVQAKNLEVVENMIVGNGIAGMPDAIRLEGIIDNSQVTGNLICGNDGSGIYLFKPDGAVNIRNNHIQFNGRRLRKAGIYVMGDNHQIIDNTIAYQSGPGVVIAAYPLSRHNNIETNKFGGLEGLSIDLNTQQNIEPIHFQRGDGTNPIRTSRRQSKETGNAAINAPQFISKEFFILGDTVEIIGKAEPGATVEIYRVWENNSSLFGPLNGLLKTVTADEEGKFTVKFDNLQPGDRISAIATHPDYGTSEPALNALIQSPTNPVTITETAPETITPQCNTLVELTPPPRPVPPITQNTPPQPLLPPREPLRLQIPRIVHFALDESTISPESAAVLDKVTSILQEYSFLTLELEGHTDPRASDAYNQALGNRRALAVRNYLLRRGIEPERMTIRSFGETQRRTTGTDILDYARDRRVELIFQDTRGLDIIFEEQEDDLQPESSRGRRR